MKLPSGVYTGRLLSVSVPFVGLLARLVWRGKVVQGDVVLNRLGPFVGLQGHQESGPGFLVYIRYPFLGLVDELREVEPGVWNGRMRSDYRWLTAEFVLRRQ